MKILLATGLYPPEGGGPATYAALIERELPKYGFHVNVFPFRVVRRWPPVIRHILFFARVLWFGRKHDVIFAQDTISVGLPAMLAAKLLRKPFILRVPGDYAWEQARQRFGVKESIEEFNSENGSRKDSENRSRKVVWQVELLKKIQKWVVNCADRVIVPSDYFKNIVLKWVKNNPSKVVRIYNGIELENSKSYFRNRNTKLRQKTILSAGRLVPWKGFDTLIEMMKDLPGWRLKIVGDGPQRRVLELKIADYGLKDRVELFGNVPRETLLQLLSEARVFVLNTSFESFSFQIVEAMNAGVPVVATDVCNLNEIIENGKEGILIKPNNKQQIVAAVAKLDENHGFRKKVIENARKKAQMFSIQKTSKELIEVFKNL